MVARRKNLSKTSKIIESASRFAGAVVGTAVVTSKRIAKNAAMPSEAPSKGVKTKSAKKKKKAVKATPIAKKVKKVKKKVAKRKKTASPKKAPVSKKKSTQSSPGKKKTVARKTKKK